ncbi:unnamed protein product, partial [marine sediment metagenome]
TETIDMGRRQLNIEDLQLALSWLRFSGLTGLVL